MPVPTAHGDLVQFRYAPDYLRPKRWHHTVTDGAHITLQLGLPFKNSPLIVDLSCTHKSDSVKTGVSRSCLSNSKSHFSDVVPFGICYILKPKIAL